jgi:predicted transposase/invertase (TIGR01784 family)
MLNLDEAISIWKAKGFMENYDRNLMQQGMQQGKQAGIREGILQTARNMLNMGIDVETIAKATGLFVDDILRL